MLMGAFDWFCPQSGETSGGAFVNQRRWSGFSDPRSGNSVVAAGGPCGFDLGGGAHPERGLSAPGSREGQPGPRSVRASYGEHHAWFW